MNLTADQITVDGDTAYVVAEGEYERCNGFPDSLRPPIVPPAWMTATCDYCGSLEPDAPFIQNCPECRNGWPIHTFDVECPTCKGMTAVADERDVYASRELRLMTCPDCKGTGTVSYRLAVREVLAVDSHRWYGTVHAKPGMYLAICEVIS